MASIAQIIANRENAKSSTGPTSPEGKAASSLNHRSHGLTAVDPVLPNEDRNQFNALVQQYKSDWIPITLHQKFLVLQMAGAVWKLNRVERMETDLFAALDDPTKAFTDKETAAGFTKLERYRAALERTYHRCARELRASRKLQNEPNYRQAAENEMETLARRLHEPAVTLTVLERPDKRSRSEHLTNRMEKISS